MDRVKFITAKNWDELPKTSGVYFFYNLPTGRQAKSSLIYIGKAINIKNRVKSHFFQPSYRDNLFIDKVNKIGYLETNSEIEALILEANLIKKHQPKFNVIWKDGKNYFFVAIAKNENNVPYVFITHQPASAKGYGEAKPEYIGPFVEGTALKKTLRFLRKAFPYYTTKKHSKNKCTYCHLDLCPGPNPNIAEYKKNIKKLVLILKGKRGAVLSSLKKEMKQLSRENKFEEAGKIRDKIYNLQNVMSHTHVINAQTEVVENLSNDKNATGSSSFETLAKILNIEKINRIECYDVSNIQGKMATGSMVVFTNGAPDKSQYKKFKIKLSNEPNDIAMLKETLQRRFLHPEWQYPEVILIDGGKGQLNVAVSVIPANAGIQVISIAKGRQELFIEGRQDPIPLKNLPQEVYNLIKQLDDEAHRFAITYHKKLRKKNLLQ